MNESERPPGQGWLPPSESRDAPSGPPPAPPPPPGANPPGSPPQPAQPPTQPAQPPTPPTQPTQPAAPTYSYGQPYAAPHAVASEPGNGEATAALVLGIVAIVLVVPLGIFAITLPVALICGVIAVVLGRSGRRKVDRGQTSRKRGQAQAGFVMGVIGTALAVLAIVGFILLLTMSPEFQRGFERGLEQGQQLQ